MDAAQPKDIDGYIARFPQNVHKILKQVRKTLGFGQIDAAVVEGSPGKLARLGLPQAMKATQRTKNRGKKLICVLSIFTSIVACLR